MSADNWAVCPACKAKWDDALDTRAKQVEAAYGKVSADAYEGMRAAFQEMNDRELPRDFREDYDIGMVDGIFAVDYSGRCLKCGHGYSYKYSSGAMKERYAEKKNSLAEW